MKPIRVAAAILNQTPLDWERNKCNILGAIDDARKQGAAILCLPELCVCGYGCEDEFLSPAVQDTSLQVLAELLPATAGMAVSFGLPLVYRNALFNTACFAANGRIEGFVAKRFLAGDGIHYEPRWFKPWPRGLVAEVTLPDGATYPLGDLDFDCSGIRIGFEICEDAWAARRPGSAMAASGIDVILNPSASHFAFGKAEVRRRLVLEGSRAFGVTYVYTNLLGNEAGRVIYDGGALIAASGHMITAGPRFSYAPWVVTSATSDLELTRASQARSASFQPELEEEPRRCVAVPFAIPEAMPAAPDLRVDLAGWEAGSSIKEEEFARAVALGLMDYLEKSRSSGFVVSLSGGVDSATCACLVALGVRFAVAELGMNGFLQRLRLPAGSVGGTQAELIRRLLLTVYQATVNSSQVTREAARQVAEAVGSEHLELDVQAMVDAYTGMIAAAVGRQLTWGTDDIALQNIQARVRAPGVWMLANMRNALLLSTSNRSEAAVGYATMDGDTSGGLSPIAGIDKNYLRQWLRWLQTAGPAGLGPYPALEAVTCQAPTAELRPAEQCQTDEKDLMPYDVLDAVERAAIRDKRSPVEVFQLMRLQFQGHSAADLALWTERFFRLWSRNQWKRERYAPSFHLDDENLDPKTWCRFPILSGGFERELTEMRRYAAQIQEKESGRDL